MKIKEIATETGFENAQVLQRTFKKLTGVTMSEYREILKIS